MTDGRWKVLFQKTVSLIAMALGYAPAFALLAAFGMPDTCLYALWLSLLVVPFGMPQFLLKGRTRAVYAPLSAVLYAALCAWMLPRGTGLMGYAGILIGCVLLLITPKAAKAPIGSEWSVGLWAGALITSLFAQLLLRARGLAEQGQVAQLCQALVCCCVCFLFLMLMNLNRASMDMGTVSKGRTGVSPSMLKRNRGSVLLLFAIALIVSLWGTLAEWVNMAFEAFMRLLRFVLSLIPLRRDEGILSEEGVMSIDPGMAVGEAVEKSAFAIFMDQLLLVIGYAAALALAVFVMYFLAKRLAKLFRWMGGRFRDYVNRASEDYEDETESIFDAEEVKKLLGDKVKEILTPKKKPRAPKWQELDGRGKIRYLYRMFYDRHPKQQHLTAREALLSDDTVSKSVSVPFAAMYDKARYSDHPISEKDAEMWKEKLKY